MHHLRQPECCVARLVLHGRTALLAQSGRLEPALCLLTNKVETICLQTYDHEFISCLHVCTFLDPMLLVNVVLVLPSCIQKMRGVVVVGIDVKVA